MRLVRMVGNGLGVGWVSIGRRVDSPCQPLRRAVSILLLTLAPHMTTLSVIFAQSKCSELDFFLHRDPLSVKGLKKEILKQ